MNTTLIKFNPKLVHITGVSYSNLEGYIIRLDGHYITQGWWPNLVIRETILLHSATYVLGKLYA